MNERASSNKALRKHNMNKADVFLLKHVHERSIEVVLILNITVCVTTVSIAGFIESSTKRLKLMDVHT